MRLLELVKRTLLAFKREDERHLAFIYGYRFEGNSFLQTKSLDYRRMAFLGVVARSLVFFRKIQRRTRIGRRRHSRADYLIYAGTSNQLRALVSTAKYLNGQGCSHLVVLEASVVCNEPEEIGNSVYVEFSFFESFSALLLFFARAPGLYRRLITSKNRDGVRKYFDKFCCTYIYMPYFFDLLDTVEPHCVIISNDHNPQNRCLKLAAEVLGVKTVFMQHGSGNVFLPPLDFDYAFLDGYESVEKYEQCQGPLARSEVLVTSNTTQIFLSGKKYHAISQPKTSTEFCIGLAINPHDGIDQIVGMLTVFLDKGFSCIVRAHPEQEPSDRRVLEELTRTHVELSLSHFHKEAVEAFLSRCSFLIAGNSSIHLEAALAHIPTYYIQFGKKGLPWDHLHHVRGGIANVFPSEYALLNRQEIERFSTHSASSSKVIRKFSESYGTPWEGREGELVVLVIEGLRARPAKIPEFLRKRTQSLSYQAIFDLGPL